jgi:hypothetical protein
MALKDKAARIDLSHIGLASGNRGQGAKDSDRAACGCLYFETKRCLQKMPN